MEANSMPSTHNTHKVLVFVALDTAVLDSSDFQVIDSFGFNLI